MSALQGQTAVVTGGSKGIGLAIAHALAGGGADVVLVARNRADLDAAVAEVGAAATGAVSGVAADVSSAHGVVPGTSSLYTLASRTRRAISWLNWDPKSRTRTVCARAPPLVSLRGRAAVAVLLRPFPSPRAAPAGSSCPLR